METFVATDGSRPAPATRRYRTAAAAVRAYARSLGRSEENECTVWRMDDTDAGLSIVRVALAGWEWAGDRAITVDMETYS